MTFALKPRRFLHGPWIIPLFILLGAGSCRAELVVIANKSGAADNMTRDEVANVFMGRVSSLPGGAAAAPQDLPASHPLRDEFYTKVTGKSAAQARSYWAKMAFTGKGTPPKEAESSAEVKRAVAANPGGIGYIEKSAVDGSVKVVLTVN